MARDLGQQGRDTLALQIMSKDDSRALHALEICTDQDIKEAAPLVSGVMQRPVITETAAEQPGSFATAKQFPNSWLLLPAKIISRLSWLFGHWSLLAMRNRFLRLKHFSFR